MIVIVVLDHNVLMVLLLLLLLLLMLIMICEWLGFQQSRQIHVLGSCSRDHHTSSSSSVVVLKGLTGCGASIVAGVSKVANAHG
jgi:hypothetical protein